MLTTTLHCAYISDIPPLITARFICVYLYLNRCVASEASEVALAGRVLSGHHWRTRIAAWSQSSRPYGAMGLARSEGCGQLLYGRAVWLMTSL